MSDVHQDALKNGVNICSYILEDCALTCPYLMIVFVCVRARVCHPHNNIMPCLSTACLHAFDVKDVTSKVERGCAGYVQQHTNIDELHVSE